MEWRIPRDHFTSFEDPYASRWAKGFQSRRRWDWAARGRNRASK